MAKPKIKIRNGNPCTRFMVNYIRYYRTYKGMTTQEAQELATQEWQQLRQAHYLSNTTNVMQPKKIGLKEKILNFFSKFCKNKDDFTEYMEIIPY